MSDQNEIYSKVVRAGKRTYFFDIKSTKGNDLYITLTESKKSFGEDGNDNYQKHKIFLYKEDFNRFIGNLEDVISYIKTELMPNYDYDEFSRRHEEYENGLEFDEDYPKDQNSAENKPKLNSEEDVSW